MIVIFGGLFTPKYRSPPFLFSENPKRELKKGGTHNGEERILPLCKRTKGKSQRADIQSLLAGKRT